MMMTKFRRNAKAISPIFATLILIAIAVIAGIVVYMFTSGTIAALTGGGTTGQEKVAVQSASASGNIVTVIYQWTGGPQPTVTGILLRAASGNVIAQLTLAGTVTPTATGTLTTVTGSNASAIAAGTYTVSLVTKAGGTFNSPSFTV